MLISKETMVQTYKNLSKNDTKFITRLSKINHDDTQIIKAVNEIEEYIKNWAFNTCWNKKQYMKKLMIELNPHADYRLLTMFDYTQKEITTKKEINDNPPPKKEIIITPERIASFKTLNTSSSYPKLAIWLCLVSGRRINEICSSDFQIYEGNDYPMWEECLISFNLSKQKNGTTNIFPLLTKTEIFIEKLNKFRHKIEGYNQASVRRAVNQALIDDKLTVKDLRCIYAKLYHLEHLDFDELEIIKIGLNHKSLKSSTYYKRVTIVGLDIADSKMDISADTFDLINKNLKNPFRRMLNNQDIHAEEQHNIIEELEIKNNELMIKNRLQTLEIERLKQSNSKSTVRCRCECGLWLKTIKPRHLRSKRHLRWVERNPQ
jgi:hypothetical protein